MTVSDCRFEVGNRALHAAEIYAVGRDDPRRRMVAAHRKCSGVAAISASPIPSWPRSASANWTWRTPSVRGHAQGLAAMMGSTWPAATSKPSDF